MVPCFLIRLLLNTNTEQQVRILWSGIFSSSFGVINGVRQGGIISPILFCIYFDVLLIHLREAGVGCYTGFWFVSSLAYPGNIVLIAPTAIAVRQINNAIRFFSHLAILTKNRPFIAYCLKLRIV